MLPSREAALTEASISKPCTIISANIQGLYSRNGHHKIGMLAELAEEENASFIALTETHLREEILDSEISIKEFDMFRADRIGASKGGTILYVKRSSTYRPIEIMAQSIGNIETIALYLEKLHTIIVVVYRPPTAIMSNFKATLNKIEEILSNYAAPTPTVLITGDFNLPMIDWTTENISATLGDLREQAMALLEFKNKWFLQQIIQEATRLENILDLFMTNDDRIIMNAHVRDTILSDHRLLLIRTKFKLDDIANSNIEERNFRKFNFFDKNIDWSAIVQDINNTLWEPLFLDKSCEEMVDVFNREIGEIIKNHIPLKIIRNRSLIPKDRRILMRNRSNILRRINKNINQAKLITLRNNLQAVERKIVESHITERSRAEQIAVNKIKTNSKYFFKYANSKSKAKTEIGPFLIDGLYINEPNIKATELLRQFTSVYSSQPYGEEVLEELTSKQGVRGFDSMDINEHNLILRIMRIKDNAAPGPDGIPPILLKKTADAISHPICCIWKQAMFEERIPAQMKTGIITPIYKGGDKSLPANYRPVSLTSHIVKIFERLMCDKLIEYISEIGVWNENQHGFRKGYSCLSQLMEHHQRIVDILEDGDAVDIVYLDFCKAFDKVDHKILLEKLSSIGVAGSVLLLIGSFLIGRRQAVVVDGYRSEYEEVGSGVPQGSVLGPLLFLIHIADIDKDLKFSSASSFADDTRITMRIRDQRDCGMMQEDLESVYEWARANNMFFNTSKFVHLRYMHPQCNLRNDVSYRTSAGDQIGTIQSTKDLGVEMSSTAEFSLQVSQAAKKGQRQAAWILRTFVTRKKFPMLTLFKSLVLPLVEYCCQLWSPAILGDIRAIESVQRNFTSKIDGMESLTYWERLDELGLYSLERRRERYKIIYVFKVLKG